MIVLISICGLALLRGRANEPTEPAGQPPWPALQGEAATQRLKEQGLYSSLAEAIAVARYQAQPLPAANSFEFVNLAHDFRALFTDGAMRVVSSGAERNRELVLRLTGYGYGSRLIGLSPRGIEGRQNRIEYSHYPESAIPESESAIRNPQSAIKEWFVNSAAGIEHGFTLPAPPPLDRNGHEPLRVQMEIGGDWQPRLDAATQTVTLAPERGDGALSYSKLRVSDARGRDVAAHFELAGNRLVIVVDDRTATYPLTIDPLLAQQARLTAADGTASDFFGFSVAISGDTALIGAIGDEVVAGGQQGSAYVFVRSGGLWTQQARLNAVDGAAGDHFGSSVALSGDTAVIGARSDDVGVNADQGSAYVFVRSGTTWSQQQKLIAADGAVEDLFGRSVALGGETLVIGAHLDDIGANANQGSAYVFVRSGTTWSQQQKLTATDGAANDLFGASVALSGDTVVVGAFSDDIGANSSQGSAYIFVRSGTIWIQQQKLTASDGAASDLFGVSVALSGDTAVVGASFDDIGAKTEQGSAYVFVRSGTSWSQQRKLIAADGAASDFFGSSVALSGDTVVVGAFGNDIGARTDQGSAYLFTRNGAAWTEQRKLTASDGVASDRFGESVALSGDTVVVGASGNNIGANADQGSAYVFVICGNLLQRQKLIASDGASPDNFGRSIALSGDTVVVGAIGDDFGANTDQGSAYVFVRNGATWSQQQKLIAADGAANDAFGFSVALSGDTVVVGASEDGIGSNKVQGSAYVFVRSGTTWSQQQKLTATDGGDTDFFGISVAVRGDTVVVGAFGDDIGANMNQGSAYVFVRNGTTWSQQQKLAAPDGATFDSFAFSVALDGETLVVGAYGDDIGANTDQGSAYIFVRSGTTWSQQQKLTAADGADGDFFGGSVALNGETVVAGSFRDGIGANTAQGSAYVFVCSSCPAISLNPTVLPAGAIGVSYNQNLTASGGTGPHRFSLSAGSLPPGLTLAQNGLLTGTPAAAGSFSFTITATDSNLCPGSRAYTLVVTSSCPAIAVNPAGPALPEGKTGLPYSQSFTAMGGTAPHSFAVGVGTLPPGLSLSAGGTISGTPAAIGAFSFSIVATDGTGCRGTRAYTLAITLGCSFSVSPTARAFSTTGGNGTVNVSASNGCVWTAESKNEWITITSGASGSGNGLVTFTVAGNPGATTRIGALTVAGQKVTIIQAPRIACVSAASFAGGALASESIVAAFGAGLAKTTEVANTQPLPTTLAGAQVIVNDSAGQERLAPLFFVSPTQINFQIPQGTATGNPIVTVISDNETVAAGAPRIETVSPGLFSADANGQGVAAAVVLRIKANGAQSFEPVARFDSTQNRFVATPIDLGPASDQVFLALFGTGIRFRNALSSISSTIGGASGEALFAGAAPGFVGLDQVNIRIPRILAGRGEVNVVLSVDGQAANPVRVNIR